MRLTKAVIKMIETHLELGYVLEMKVDSEGRVDLNKRPPETDLIEIKPTLLSDSDPTTLQIRILKLGEGPIPLVNIDIEPNTWVGGLKIFKGISQKMESES